MSSVAIVATLLDKNGNRGRVSLHVARFLLPSEELPIVTQFVTWLETLSDAIVSRVDIRITTVIANAGDIPSSVEMNGRKMLLFFGETEQQSAMIAIPSPRHELFYQTGPQAGLIVDPSHPAVEDFISEVVEGDYIARGDGQPMGPYLIGGLAL